uniref:Uncharacterized protein n=1 Tax=Cajanus cajan TaxID=3821 RepID=A0A151RFA6_CAJCA|nr:hypothetical protein KK1_037316 [Cajanus cajan]
MEDLGSGSGRREGISVTRLSRLIARRIAKERIPIEMDPRSGKASGPNAAKFKSYLGVLARWHVSIIIPSWDDVQEADKNLMWQDIQQNFDIPNTELMRRKMLSALATRWRDFKTFLTREYVFGERQNETPCLKYQITDEEWMQFRATRLDPSWQAKRIAAQERQTKNDAPHLLSRGGYELKKMMKASAEAAGVESADRVESASRHEMWIAARTKSDGQMTSESARVVADKIEGLVEQTTQGSFVSHGRDDILTTAIGRLEHAGRVRGVGCSWSHLDFFGARSSRSSTVDSYS